VRILYCIHYAYRPRPIDLQYIYTRLYVCVCVCMRPSRSSNASHAQTRTHYPLFIRESWRTSSCLFFEAFYPKRESGAAGASRSKEKEITLNLTSRRVEGSTKLKRYLTRVSRLGRAIICIPERRRAGRSMSLERRLRNARGDI